jgi:hypothetical protein
MMTLGFGKPGHWPASIPQQQVEVTGEATNERGYLAGPWWDAMLSQMHVGYWAVKHHVPGMA